MIHYITTTGIGNAWVGNELRVVQQAGVPFVLHSMRDPGQTFFESEWAGDLSRRTRTLYPVPVLGFVVSLLAAPFLFHARFFSSLGNALFGTRESFRTRCAGIWHFLVACHWARGLRREAVSHIHSQWIHSAGTIGMYGARLLDVSFSFTGHAADLFRERCALTDKIRRADFIVCISEFHRRFYLDLGAPGERLHTVYCGIDLSHFTPQPRPPREGRPFRILSSGRLVEKKGFVHLIRACKILQDRGLDFECVIGGSGPLYERLAAEIRDLGVERRVRMTGNALKQEAIPEFMGPGDVYALPCVWASDGDVDGLPQMLMEAMACGLPAVSTRLVGIPDLVIHDRTGLLVEPGNERELADALERLAADASLCSRLAAEGERHVRERFEIRAALRPLLERFRERLKSFRPAGGAGAPSEAASEVGNAPS